MTILRFTIAFALLLVLSLSSRAQSSGPVPSDFNGDGIPDIVWHNRSTGSTSVWFMDGGTGILGTAGFPDWDTGDVNWWISAVADFNGDGKPDLLWRNYGNGRNVVWLLDGTTLVSVLELPPVQDVTWSLCGS